jgi:hypothetical protein
MAARLPIKWPESIREMFKALDALASSQEVFSVDCSISEGATSKVFLKATAYLVLIVVRRILWRISTAEADLA